MPVPSRPIASVGLTHLKSKSARIRFLKDLGYRQVDIARHLGLREQHVSNVVRGPRPKSETPADPGGVREPATRYDPEWSLRPTRIEVDGAGRVQLPPEWGVPRGQVFIGRRFGMSVVLMEVENASLAARTGANLESAVDDLLAERRLEAMREFDD
jgi:hypothetical protein